MSRNFERSDIPFQGKIVIKGQKAKFKHGQSFVRPDTTGSVNGVTSPERKSGRKYETFVMTGDKIIRTTSEQDDSEKRAPIKNKELPLDNTVITPESATKKKKTEHSRSKIPKPSSISSPKVPPKVIQKDTSPQESPKTTTKLVKRELVKHSPKLIKKDVQQKTPLENSPQSSPKLNKKDSSYTSPQGSPNIKQKGSPHASPKKISSIPQKVTKVLQKENPENENVTADIKQSQMTQSATTQPCEQNPVEVSNTEIAIDDSIISVSITHTQQSPIRQKCEYSYNEDSTHSTVAKSHLPTLSGRLNQSNTHTDSMPYGYNNQTHYKQKWAEKRSPFDEIQKPVYHTCAAMPIELDIPPDDICSDDERYNRMDDEIDMDNLPPPPAELLQDYTEKENTVRNGSFFVPHNHVFQRDETTAVNSSPQQMPASLCTYEQLDEQSLGGNAINYSSPIQQSTRTEINSVMKSVHSDLQNITGSTLNSCNAVINDNQEITKEHSNENNCIYKAKEELNNSNAGTAVTTVTSPLIETPAGVSTYGNSGSSLATSRIPCFINISQQNQVVTHSKIQQSKNHSQKQQPEGKSIRQYDNKNINENKVDLHNSDISTSTHEGFITNNCVNKMPQPPLIQQTINEVDMHEDFLDNVLESQTPMDMSFNVPTPPSERDNQNLISNRANTLVNKNLPSNNKNVSDVSKLDYLNEAATKLRSGEINSDYNVEINALDNKESLANIQDEPRRGMVTSISGENFGYKTLPSKSTPSHGVGLRDHNSGRNQSPALVRNSKSHENYLDDKDMTMIDIDFEDNIASSVDALHYDQSCTSLDKFNGFSPTITEQSKSLDNSPERRYEKHGEKIYMPTFFSIEEPKSVIKQRENMKVKESPKRENVRGSTSSSEVSPTHEACIPEEPSLTYNIKSEGSSPSHQYTSHNGDSALIQKVIAAEKTNKPKSKSPKVGITGVEKHKKKHISKSADNSPVHISKTKLPSYHPDIDRDSNTCVDLNGKVETISHSPEYGESRDKTDLVSKSPTHGHVTSETNYNSTDNNVNKNNNDIIQTPQSVQSQSFVQSLSSEPRSPRRIYHDTSGQSSSNSVSSPSDKDTAIQSYIQSNDSDISKTYFVSASSNCTKKEVVTSKTKGQSPGRKKKVIQGQSQQQTVESAQYSHSKHKHDLNSGKHHSSTVNSSDKTEPQFIGNFDQNDGPPPYSLVEGTVHSNYQQPYIKINSSNKSSPYGSPNHSPTKTVQPVFSPQRESSHKLDAPHFEPVPSGSGPSSPDSDTGSIYHQPLKDVDLPSAQRLAKRLFELEGFKKKDISKHLSKKNDFAQQVGEEFLKYFNFADEGLDNSLRKFLKHITLAGETQERERVLVHFSKRYMECNPESFNSEDAAHTLTCALLLLNTDLHGQNVGQKMSLGEFIENLSDLNDGENFPKEVLKSMYHSIKLEPLEWEFDEGSEGLVQDFDLIQAPGHRTMPSEQQKYLGHNPFLDVPDPDKVTEYKKGYVMRKCCIDPDGRKTAVGKRGWKMFYGVLKDMILYLYKDEHAFKKTAHYDNMSNAIRFHHGLATKATDYKKKQHVLRVLTADSAEYLFQTSNPDECQSWIDSLNLVAALFSAPPLPGAVGSQKKFQRPLLPASYTRFNMREQYQHHEQKVIQVDRELIDHRKYPPEKGSKSRIIQDYIEKEQYLQFELRRFKTYTYQLQVKLSAYPELEPSLVETAICEVSEPPSPNTEQKNGETSPLAAVDKSPKRTDKSNATSPKEREKKSRSVGRSQSDRIMRERKHKSLPESVLTRYRPSFDDPNCYGTAV